MNALINRLKPLKFFVSPCIVIILSLMATIANAHHWVENTPEFYDCDPNMELSITGDTLWYDPLISTDCPLFFGAALSNFYELRSIDITIQHQIYLNGAWQAGPKQTAYHYTNWQLDETNHLIWSTFQVGGGINIEGNNTTLNRYRLLVNLHGATTHEPFVDVYEDRVDPYDSNWIYGNNPIRVDTRFDDAPNELVDTERKERSSDQNSSEAPVAVCELVGNKNGTWYCKAATGDLASEACEVTTGVSSEACSTQPDGGVECACVF